jgi:hypothetical protein
VAVPRRRNKVKLSGCAGLCIITLLGLLIVVGMLSWRAKSELDHADRLYAEGDRAEAVAKYKANFSFVAKADKSRVVQRIVEFEAERGDETEARRWIELALDNKLDVAYGTAGAKDLLSRVQAEIARRAEEEYDADGLVLLRKTIQA